MQTRAQINTYQRAYYHKNIDKVRKYPSYRSERRKAANKRWHKENPDKIKASRNRAAKAYRERNKQWLQIYKRSQVCIICGESDSICLDFHHRDPSTKKFSIRNGVNRGKAAMLREIAKCDILCSNCHRKVTYPHLT